MFIAIISGFFTLCGVIVGWLISWRMHMNLRVEKFKEITYKEQLAVYKELAQRIGKLYATALDCLCKANEPAELINETIDYGFFLITKGFLIPQPLHDEANKFSFDILNPLLAETMQEIFKEPPQPLSIEGKIKLIEEAYVRIQNLLRDQFQTDHITEAIQTTINPEYRGFKSTRKTKQKTQEKTYER